MSKLRLLRDQLEISQARLAELVGTSQPQIRRLENGDRTLTKEWAERLAGPLGTTAEFLLFGNDVAVEGLEVLGVIEAGNFRDISLINQDEERERIGVGKDMRFPQAAQYALRVSGDSMNQKYPDGSYVTCVNLEESGLKLKPGLIVHVEQTRDGGLLTEVSLKEIQSTNGVTMLIPRSTNPKHGPLTYDQGETSTVKIRGIVTGMWQPEKL